jgi:hypothetical protein
VRPNCWKSIISVALYKINIILTSYGCSRASCRRYKVRTIRLRMCSIRSCSNNIFSTKRSGYKCYKVNLGYRSQDKRLLSNKEYRNKAGGMCHNQIQRCTSKTWMCHNMIKASGRSFFSNKMITLATKLNKRAVLKPTRKTSRSNE